MTRFFLLKITLKDVQTPVWRQFVVPANIPLNVLHLVIQRIMGWENRQDYIFKAGGARYVADEPFNDFLRPATDFWLSDIGKGDRAKFKYTYDMQHDWVHEVLVESTDYPNPDRSHPVRCLDGAGACPPSSCEGPHGFWEMNRVLADPKHPDYREMKKRYGKFDPARFNKATVNKAFKIVPKEKSEPLGENDVSPGMAAIYNEMRRVSELVDKNIFGDVESESPKTPVKKTVKKVTEKTVKKSKKKP